MGRPIDADALKELFSEVIGHIAKKPEMNGNLEHMIRASAMVIQMIDDAPTVQQEIIRCKDCKYCEHWYADKGRCFLWHEGGIDVFEEGFCNYAERREDG